ncbi:MAG: NAD(P)-dependent oxidoreductase [Actinomycetota bacterium]
MNLTVFGSAGGTGRQLVARALGRGHSVTAFVRSATDDEALAGVARVVTGDARNADAVASALRDAEAVVSAMGPKGPEPGSVYSDAIGTLARSMQAGGVRRLVISANSRVLDERPLEGPYAAVSQEHRDALATLRACELDWTVVATPALSDEEARGVYDVVVGGRSSGHGIARADFATALLDALDHPEWVGQVVGVSTPD